jgi:TetR/AcrR family transcriptional regulator, repressor for uid operon
MPKLPPAQMENRRYTILAAAERAFARHGFHGTSMQAICREAGISPGTLYLYFPSKVALIAGLCERDRTEVRDALSHVEVATDVLSALEAVLTHYACAEPQERRALIFEIGAEAQRNPDIAKLMVETDAFLSCLIRDTILKAVSNNQLIAKGDIDAIIALIFAVGDGILWRATIRPELNNRTIIRKIFTLIREQLLTSPASFCLDTAAP